MCKKAFASRPLLLEHQRIHLLETGKESRRDETHQMEDNRNEDEVNKENVEISYIAGNDELEPEIKIENMEDDSANYNQVAFSNITDEENIKVEEKDDFEINFI